MQISGKVVIFDPVIYVEESLNWISLVVVTLDLLYGLFLINQIF